MPCCVWYADAVPCGCVWCRIPPWGCQTTSGGPGTLRSMRKWPRTGPRKMVRTGGADSDRNLCDRTLLTIPPLSLKGYPVRVFLTRPPSPKIFSFPHWEPIQEQYVPPSPKPPSLPPQPEPVSGGHIPIVTSVKLIVKWAFLSEPWMTSLLKNNSRHCQFFRINPWRTLLVVTLFLWCR